MAESLHIDVNQDDNGSEKAHDRTGCLDQKVTTLERVVLVTNFILELPSVFFDQLSSVRKPQYALLSMSISFIVVILSIIDLAYKGKKERVTWMKRGLITWFYHPYPNTKPFGKFVDIIGLVCAFFQFIFATIAYAFLSGHADNPIKVSAWPIIFACGLLFSRLLGNSSKTKPTPPVRRLTTAEEFTLAELTCATNNFSRQNRIGSGHFGVVYRGKLSDGRTVAVKRWNRVEHSMMFVDNERAFESELTILSRIHHKHLVRLYGYCEDRDERILVFEYMKHRSLYDCLHDKNNIHKNSSMINSWKMRIKVALETTRIFEYLHNYTIPRIIHRDLKSYNVLLDLNWTVKVSHFGFSLLVSESEYDSRYVLTANSDVYSLGVLFLELLTGKLPIFKDDDSGGSPISIVDFAVPKILANELIKVLDNRVGPPEHANEAEAVEMVAYTALHCVNFERKTRPNLRSIVANLEKALSLCHDSMVDY